MKTVLCFSRSYLATLLPQLMAMNQDLEPLHIVQNDVEEKQITATGQKVILNLRTLSKTAILDPSTPDWVEPDDMRALTKFLWDPIQSDRYLPEFPEFKHKKLAGVLQNALNDIFESHDIAAVLSEPVALFPTHYMLYLCKKYGAVPLYWANTYFPGYFYFVDQPHLANPKRATLMNVAADGPEAQSIQSYLERVAADKAGPVYHHKFAQKSQGGMNYFSQRRGEDALILTPDLTSKALQFARYTRAVAHKLLFPYVGDYISGSSYFEHAFYMRNMMARLSKYDVPAGEYDKCNVFFPLQYVPEASLLYAAPWARDQKALVESMLQALPAGHRLWVKEHPNQFGPLAAKEWQALRKRYPNLRLVYGRENGRHLIQRCGLAVCITSTAGMDALVLGRKCIVMGDVFFQDFPGAFRVDSVKELVAALNWPEIYTDEGVLGELEAIAQASVAIARNSYPGDPQPSASLYEDQNMKHLSQAIRTELGLMV